MGQHAIDDQHVIGVIRRERQSHLSVTGEIGGMTVLFQRFLKKLRGFLVVFDYEHAHGVLPTLAFYVPTV